MILAPTVLLSLRGQCETCTCYIVIELYSHQNNYAVKQVLLLSLLLFYEVGWDSLGYATIYLLTFRADLIFQEQDF